MISESLFFACFMAGVLVTCLLDVAFGQVTVRKLRKNPETRDALGLEYASGWDVINVAQSLAFPRYWTRKLERGPLSFMHADADLIHQHTGNLDRFLGTLFYWVMMISGLSGALLVLLNSIGAFPD